MASGGYGRGGRGAALLQKLNEAARKPGVQDGSGEPGSGASTPGPMSGNLPSAGLQFQPLPQAGVAVNQPSASARPTGRGFLMQEMLSKREAAVAGAQQQQYQQSQQYPQQQQQPQLQQYRQPYQQQDQPQQQQYQQPPYQSEQQQLPQQQYSPPPVPGFEQMKGSNGRSVGRGRAGLMQMVTPSQPDTASAAGRVVGGNGASQGGALQSMSDLRTSLPSPQGAVGGDGTPRGTGGLENISSDQEKPPVIKRGDLGDIIELTVNYVALKCSTGGVYQYAVFFNPPVDSMAIRRSLIHEHSETIGRTKTFDGNILFLPKQLPDKETLLYSTRKTDGAQIEVLIKLVKVLPPSACIQLYNVLFKRILNILKMSPIGRHYYSPTGSVAIPQHKLELWPGYITAITEYEGGLMLNADVSHRVLRTQSVLDVISEISMANPRSYQEECLRRLVGQVVITKYNNRTYRIDEIAFDKTPMTTFDRRDGPISFTEYYQKEYGITINNTDQPMLVSLDKKANRNDRGDPNQPKKQFVSLLVPEIAYMTGISDEMRKDFRCMKDIAAHTRVTPAQRRLSLKKFCDNVNSSAEARQQLENWGLQLDNDIMELQGRVLPMERIVVNRGHADGSEAGPKADWSRNLGRGVLTTVNLENWLLIVTERDREKADRFVREYQNCGRGMGIEVFQPTICRINTDKTEAYLREIRARMTDEVQLVMTIFPSLRDDRYNAIKKLCCADAPVPSQVIITRTISDNSKLRSVTQKIALQINCKLGGELWHVKIPSKGLMVCGIDTYHDSLTKRKGSVAALVASVNRECTRYYSSVHFQQVGEELVNGLKIMFMKALRKYYAVNHCLPTRIIMFRDGVGDGQLSTVAGFEVPQLLDCFKHFDCPVAPPKFTMIIVQKRINTRLFSRQGSGPQARLDNPPPGTVVDHTVTRRDLYDFFLVSQHVGQGTVTPTHYVVLHDESDWSPGIIQSLSYKMTHMYYNWPGTIRVPAPCQYAHKLAYLVGNNIGKEHSERLSDRLFYL